MHMIFVTLLGVLLLSALTIFQLLLIAGKPLGEYAWGGQHKVLPKKLRIGSVTSIVLYAAFTVILLSKAEVIVIIPDGVFLTVAIWTVTIYMMIGILMNAISRSKKERLVMMPVATMLAGIFLFVTLGV